MAKQVILAVAGAGKTYHICHMIDRNKKNLILAFTHENIHNIMNELIHAHGSIPELTSVMTFDSFVYRYLVLPYEPTIRDFFGHSDFLSKGITTMDPPQQRILGRNGKMVANPNYHNKNDFEHYTTQKGMYYCATLSELVMQVKEGRTSLIKRAALAINTFFDHVLIDEFQDFREHDYDLIIAMAKQIDNLVLVGDYYQHSVSATHNSGRPFQKNKNEVKFDTFKSEIEKHGFSVDEHSLIGSRRCSKSVCDFVSKKLGISIVSSNQNAGDVIWVDDNNIGEVIQNSAIVKLVYNNARKYPFKAINWSYSKGDTYSQTCVILTDELEKMEDESFSISTIKPVTKNRLYVALTRSKGNLYLLRASLFKRYKSQHTDF